MVLAPGPPAPHSSVLPYVHPRQRWSRVGSVSTPSSLPLFLATRMSLFRVDSSGVSKEQKVPRPLTLLMNWGYLACSGKHGAAIRACLWDASSP